MDAGIQSKQASKHLLCMHVCMYVKAISVFINSIMIVCMYVPGAHKVMAVSGW